MYTKVQNVLWKSNKIEREHFIKKVHTTYEQYERYVCGQLSIEEFKELVQLIEEIMICRHYKNIGDMKKKFDAIDIEYLRKKALMDELFIF